MADKEGGRDGPVRDYPYYPEAARYGRRVARPVQPSRDGREVPGKPVGPEPRHPSSDHTTMPDAFGLNRTRRRRRLVLDPDHWGNAVGHRRSPNPQEIIGAGGPGEEERRVGKRWGSPCKTWGSTGPKK